MIKKIRKIRRRKKLKRAAKCLLRAIIILMLVNDVIQIAIAYRDYRRKLRKKAEKHLAKGSDKT